MRIHSILALGAASFLGAFVSGAAADVRFSITIDTDHVSRCREPVRVTHYYADGGRRTVESRWPAYGQVHHRRSYYYRAAAPRVEVHRRTVYPTRSSYRPYYASRTDRPTRHVWRVPAPPPPSTRYYYSSSPTTHYRRVYVAPSHRPSHARRPSHTIYYRR